MCQGSDALITDEKGATEMKLTTVGIDLAKSVFQVHGVDERGKTVLRKQLRRSQVLSFFARLERDGLKKLDTRVSGWAARE
jgi:hypothetical protein